MNLPEEKRENLKKAVCELCDQDILNGEDAVEIIDICLRACDRERSSLMDKGLRMRILDGGDRVC